MMTGFSLSYVIFVVVEIGIIEMIGKANSFVTLDNLSQDLKLNKQLLKRFLRVLVLAGILKKEKNKYKLSKTGKYLKKDSPKSIYNSVLMCANEGLASWSKLKEGLKTNNVPFYLEYGDMPFNLQIKNKEMAKRFNNSMITSSKKQNVGVLLQKYNFDNVEKIVDVGGGYGVVIMQILKKYNNINAIIYDLDYLKKNVEEYILEYKLNNRCKFIGGNFFLNIPQGGDIYILSKVLHDWNDEKANIILQNCKKIMKSDAKLLIIEKIIPEEMQDDNLKLALDDLNVWVMCGGRERTLNDFKTLLVSNNMNISKTIMISLNTVVIEVEIKHN